MEARARRLAATTRERSRTLRSNPTDAERKTVVGAKAQRTAGARLRRQFPLGEFLADFCCLEHKLLVEVDGGQHAQAEEYDRRRTKFPHPNLPPQLETVDFRVG